MPWVFKILEPGKGKYSFTLYVIYPWIWQSNVKKKWGDIYLDSGQILGIWDLNNLTDYMKPQKHKTVNLNEH